MVCLTEHFVQSRRITHRPIHGDVVGNVRVNLWCVLIDGRLQVGDTRQRPIVDNHLLCGVHCLLEGLCHDKRHRLTHMSDTVRCKHGHARGMHGLPIRPFHDHQG